MTTLPDSIRQSPSLEVAAERLGVHLGLKGAAPLQATERALRDANFARALAATAKLPEVLDRLLASAPAPPPSSATVAAKVVGSVLKWGMEGLEVARPWDIARRLEACAACPFLGPAPETLIYRGARHMVGPEAKVCTVCNCLTNTKAAMARERCPEQSPTDPGLSRWGEPFAPPDFSPAWPWR